MAADGSTSVPEEPSEALFEAGEKLLVEGRRLLRALESAAHYTTALRPDGTCSIFYQDEVVYVCLPFGDFERYQMHLIARRAPQDPQLLLQLFDLLPDLSGKAFVDVGSYTGSFAMIVRKMLSPAETHLFEPQKTMRDALLTTITANGAEPDTAYHDTVVDDGKSNMAMGTYRPQVLSETPYLRRDDGKLESTSIDALAIANVGLINLNFHNTKLNALSGAMKTIERDLPFITCDLAGRDLQEMRELLKPLGYEDVPAGPNSIIHVPG